MTDVEFHKAATKVMRLLEAMTESQRQRLARMVAVLTGEIELEP